MSQLLFAQTGRFCSCPTQFCAKTHKGLAFEHEGQSTFKEYVHEGQQTGGIVAGHEKHVFPVGQHCWFIWLEIPVSQATEASEGQGTAARGHPPKYVDRSTRLCSTWRASLYEVLLQWATVMKREKMEIAFLAMATFAGLITKRRWIGRMITNDRTAVNFDLIMEINGLYF